MKKNLFLTFLILYSIVSFSQSVAFSEAKKSALNFINHINNDHFIEYCHADNLIISEKERDLLYIFNFTPGGFVIISGDKRITPVLGYSLKNSFPINNIPDHVSSWIEIYTDQISKVSDENSFKGSDISSKWSALLNNNISGQFHNFFNSAEPLLRSEWHQKVPYNADCPEDETSIFGGRTLAGCVAIAMSQLMFYFRYPESGEGEHSYFSNNYDTLKADFGNTTYKWDEMVNYTYFYPNPAASELVFHCGVSVEMNYGPDGSGAYTADCVDALINHFRYSDKAKYITKADTTINYMDSLRINLDSGLPVLYSAGSLEGHSFVCDGYNDAGYFHFNFGWGGTYNGYYHLDAIIIGNYNLTSSQAAIINIIPKINHPPYCNGLKEYNRIEGTLVDGSSYLNYQPNSDCKHLISYTANNNSKIMLMLKEIDTEENKDFITVYDGNNTNSPLLAKLSGHHTDISITSSSNEILIHFSSDGQNENKGWFAEYIAFENQFCSPNNNLTNTIGFLNDRSGKYFYANNTDCNWNISPYSTEYDSISGIILEFEQLNTEANTDFIDIYNGPDKSYPLIAQISGDVIPSAVVTTSNNILVNFNSNNTVNNEGWSIYYEALFPIYCSDTTFLTSPSGTIQDGSLNKKYGNNTNCFWMIAPEYADEITLTFTQFELEWGYDRLQVYDPTVNPPALLGNFWGDAIPSPVTAKNGKMLLHFKSDESITFDGWEACYQISNVSTKETINLKNFTLFPNPAKDYISIEGISLDPGNTIINFFDATGKLQLYKKINHSKSSTNINISSLLNGLYIIQIITSDIVVYKKIIKTK